MRKYIVVLSLTMACSFSVNAELATSSKASSTNNQGIKKCTEYRDFKRSLPGTACESKKGGIFIRVETSNGDLGIAHEKSGLILLDKLKTSVDHYEASEFCKGPQLRLPTKEDFQLLEEEGFREAFNYDVKGKYLWSSTEVSSVTLNVYVFHGSEGRTHIHTRRTLPIPYFSARCVLTQSI